MIENLIRYDLRLYDGSPEGARGKAETEWFHDNSIVPPWVRKAVQDRFLARISDAAECGDSLGYFLLAATVFSSTATCSMVRGHNGQCRFKAHGGAHADGDQWTLLMTAVGHFGYHKRARQVICRLRKPL